MMFFVPLLIIFLFPCSAQAEGPCTEQMRAAVASYGSSYHASMPIVKDREMEIWTFWDQQIRFVFEWDYVTKECSVTKESLNAYKNEPDGFRDLKWGVALSSIKGMRFVFKHEDGVKFYQRNKDSLTIGNAKLSSLSYGFWKGRFCSILVVFTGLDNWRLIQGSLFKKFGDGTPIENPEKKVAFKWGGDKSIIMTSYNNTSKQGSMAMFSTTIRSEVNADKKASLDKAINHGAATGF